MVGPIMMPPRTKRRLFRIRHSPRLASFSHPLDASRDDYWDSDVESVLDSSYNESIISMTSVDSGGYSVLPLSSRAPTKRPCVTPAVVLTPLVTTRYSEPRTVSSHSKLLGLMKRHDEESRCDKRKFEERRLVAGTGGAPEEDVTQKHQPDLLPHTLRWQAFLLSIVTFAMIPFSPRSTDDAHPSPPPFPDVNRDGNGPNYDPASGNSNYSMGRELDTFATRMPQPASMEVRYSKVRNRDYRINCDFLKYYALDLRARENRMLPSTALPDEVEQLVQDPALRSFDNRYGLTTISNISREKLWDSVILPPRSDAHPVGTIDYSTYAYVGEDGRLCGGSSVVSKNGKYIPWATHRTSLRPAGVLASSKPLASNSPTGCVTPTQYTIKGWCNKRWACN